MTRTFEVNHYQVLAAVVGLGYQWKQANITWSCQKSRHRHGSRRRYWAQPDRPPLPIAASDPEVGMKNGPVAVRQPPDQSRTDSDNSVNLPGRLGPPRGRLVLITTPLY